MATELGRRTQPTVSLVPAVAAVGLGLLVHLADQFMFTRAGPIPILVTAPVVATLLYLHGSAATHRQIAALVGWGVIGSGIALLGVYLGVVNYALPRPMTGAEMVVYDLGLFLWFVASLTAAYGLAATLSGQRPRALAAVLAAPLVQVAWLLIVRLVVAIGLLA